MIKQLINASLLVLIAITLTAFVVQKAQKNHPKKTDRKKTAPPPAQVSYKKDIQPIVKKYCLPCHTEDEMNPSELYLDTYDNMMAGGKHGKPIVPGKADSSLLVMKLSMAKPPLGDPMPLKRKTPFPQDTVQIIKTWINQGAKNN
ncbi:MAG: hypothetical protein HY033_02530 [Ignavibacteriae bacterium]|nr:hypothetical protein [Ignavibacteria bacterium]MBI3363763.1 hypothetical protein [Ignavibacteriota bacterium]